MPGGKDQSKCTWPIRSWYTPPDPSLMAPTTQLCSRRRPIHVARHTAPPATMAVSSTRMAPRPMALRRPMRKRSQRRVVIVLVI